MTIKRRFGRGGRFGNKYRVPGIPSISGAGQISEVLDLAGNTTSYNGKRGSLTVNGFNGIPIFANDYIGTETLATVGACADLHRCKQHRATS